MTTLAESTRNTASLDKTSQWQCHIEQWQSSSLTQPEYCRQHRLSLATFGYWRKKLKKHDSLDTGSVSPVTFLPVNIASKPEPLKLQTKHGLQIDLQAGFDRALLKEVLQVLATLQ